MHKLIFALILTFTLISSQGFTVEHIHLFMLIITYSHAYNHLFSYLYFARLMFKLVVILLDIRDRIFSYSYSDSP